MSYAKSQTSLEAFSLLSPQRLNDMQRSVYELLCERGAMSNRLIAEALGWSINRVTPRVLELRQTGFVREYATQKDRVTNRQVQFWVAVQGWEA